MRLYDAMRKLQPDVFIHLGDTIYADQPLKSEVVLDDGSVWRNLVTEAKSKPAQTLDDFRGCHRYNLQDEHMRRFNAEVSQIALWDDHEVRDNWYPTERLDADPRAGVKSVALLAARAKRAFLENLPLRINPIESERIYRAWRHGPALEVFALDMRSYRGANSANRQPALTDDSAILGTAQVEWLERALAASRGDVEGDRLRHAARRRRAERRRRIRSGREPRGRRAARPRARDRAGAEVHQGSRDPQRRLADGRCALLRRAPLQPGARALHRVRSVLGVRRRAAPRRHVRAERARRDVRSRGQVPGHSARHETEPPAERAVSVFRQRPDRPPHAGR